MPDQVQDPMRSRLQTPQMLRDRARVLRQEAAAIELRHARQTGPLAVAALRERHRLLMQASDLEVVALRKEAVGV